MAEIFSAVLGFVLGGIVVWLWNALGRQFGDDRFWPLFRRVARDLATGASPEQFLQQYAGLLKALGAYLGNTTCRVCIAIFPVVWTCTLLAPVVSKRGLRSGDRLEVYPPQSMVVTVGEQTMTFGADGRAELPDAGLDGPVTLAASAFMLALPRLRGPIAISNSTWSCMGLQLLGLDAHCAADGPRLLILRPDLADTNPAYPFLSDVEFFFWAGLLGSSLAIGLVLQLKR